MGLKSTPHCDCPEVNKAHFGRKVHENQRQMLPVETDQDGHCVHCGHFAPLLLSQKVVGVNDVGNVIQFDSTADAYRAGFDNICKAMRLNQKSLGYYFWFEHSAPPESAKKYISLAM